MAVETKLREMGAPAAGAAGLSGEVTALFEQLRGPLLRYVLWLGLPAADGEDVVQEVFLALFDHLRRDGGRENLRGWVFRVGHNLALRRRMERGRSAGAAAEWPGADPGPNPEELAAWNRRQARLRSVMAALAERDRCCLLLRADGLRYREIAETLGMSLGAVAQAVARSLERLRVVDER